jgi:hypothetical protein
MASIICPVAKCGKRVSPENYYEHVIEYEEKYKGQVIHGGIPLWTSHNRFAEFFFPDIWNSDMAIKKKWRMIAQAYINQQKSLKKQYKHQEKQKKEERYGIEHFLR